MQNVSEFYFKSTQNCAFVHQINTYLTQPISLSLHIEKYIKIDVDTIANLNVVLPYFLKFETYSTDSDPLPLLSKCLRRQRIGCLSL